MGLAPDPADKALDAAADGAFGGRGHGPDNRRAGYGGIEFEGRHYSKYDWLLRAAAKGSCLAYGESRELLNHITVLERVADAAAHYVNDGEMYVDYVALCEALEALRQFKELKGIA